MRNRRVVLAVALAVSMPLLLSACWKGTWQTNVNPSPVRAVHAALLRTGKVLLIAGSGNDPNQFAAGTFKTTEWDPATNTFTSVPTPYDMFCSGHAFLPNGDLLVAGGTLDYQHLDLGQNYAGSKQVYEFNADTEQYVKRADLTSGHWYPTLVSVGDGRVLAVAGVNENRVRASTYQIFDPSSGTWSAERTTAMSFPTYPSLHLLADGRFLWSGASPDTTSSPPGIWDASANTYTPVTGLTDADHRTMAASVLLPPAQDQKVMVIGGGVHPSSSGTSVASTAIVDLKQPTPAFVAGAPLDTPKLYVSAVILPDRTVFETNGTNMSWLAQGRPGFNYVYSSQIYDPVTNTWDKANDATVGRSYHSEALLLPDGRVATFGSNITDNGTPFEMRIEIYTPDYYDQPRPAVSVGPSSPAVSLGGALNLGADQQLTHVELIRPSAATHSTDPDQRLVDVAFTQDPTSHAVTATLPTNRYLLPPGWYLLFGVNAASAPSVGAWVHVLTP